MNAREVKDALYARHPGSGGQMPGAWTVIEEFRSIDLLAFSAWSSAGRYARVGYEVKISRPDLRRELLRPGKRSLAVEWCNEFYLAVPKGLLTPDELAYEEPEWQPEDWQGEPCPGWAGRPCRQRWRKKTHMVEIPRPTTSTRRYDAVDVIRCPTCKGKGYTVASRVEREAPNCWVPRDLGLIVVDGRGSRLVKRSPRRRTVPELNSCEVGQLVRWVSMRPDPRHAASRARREPEQLAIA